MLCFLVGFPVSFWVFVVVVVLFLCGFFFWLHWVLAAARGIFVAACRIFYYSVWAPEHVGSVVAARGLSSCGSCAQ